MFRERRIRVSYLLPEVPGHWVLFRQCWGDRAGPMGGAGCGALRRVRGYGPVSHRGPRHLGASSRRTWFLTFNGLSGPPPPAPRSAHPATQAQPVGTGTVAIECQLVSPKLNLAKGPQRSPAKSSHRGRGV
jgi:hypothetical protein